MKRINFILDLSPFVLILAIIVISLAVLIIDINQYRVPLTNVLSENLGKKVDIEGPIYLGVSQQGLVVTLENVSIKNPSWSQAANMAVIKRIDLGVRFLPLFKHQVVVTMLTIDHASIGFETSEKGENNWPSLNAENGLFASLNARAPVSSPDNSVVISIDHLFLVNSQFSSIDREGNKIVFMVRSMTLSSDDQFLEIHFDSLMKETPFQGDIRIGVKMENDVRPITLDFMYNNARVLAQGKANLSAKLAYFDNYRILAGASAMGGRVSVNGARDRLLFQGTLTSQQMSTEDFLSTGQLAPPLHDNIDNLIAAGPRYLSNAELGLNDLKYFDAIFDVDLNNVTISGMTIGSLRGPVDLHRGFLSAPLKVLLGKSDLDGDIQINALSMPAQVGIKLNSSNVDFVDLLGLIHVPAFISGPADVKTALLASGGSLHELASSLSGVIDVVAADGQVSSEKADEVSSLFMKLFTPEGASSLNCFAARFIAEKGIIHDNGILISTPVVTIAGNGGFNLNNETINILLHAQTNVIQLGGFLPPLLISGTFLKPTYSLKLKTSFHNFIDVLSGRSLLNGVPEIVSPPGQNACLYTLQHPPIQEEPQGGGGSGFKGAIERFLYIGDQFKKGFWGE